MEKEHDLAKWLAGEMSETELRAFEATPEFATYDKIARAAARLEAPVFRADETLEAIYASHEKVVPISGRTPWKHIASLAALLVIALGIFFWLGRPVTVTELAAADQTKSLTLPDASEVVLNSRSQLSYDKTGWDGQRQVRLEGEAFFSVAKGQRFDVLTDNGQVTVLGTRFNVREIPSGLEVECFEGRVRVAASGRQIILTEGMSARSKNGEITQQPVYYVAPVWMGKTLRFESAGLDNILQSLEKSYGVVIENRSGKTGTFTGDLPADDLAKAVSIICKTYNLKARSVQNKLVLSMNE